jgi:5-methyltetrahydrofolate--homocysteine methyltransferase
VMTPDFLSLLNQRILVFDGATGTSLQMQNLTADDFGGKQYEGCNEYLLITRPEAARQVHLGFLEAGADIIETNSFGATRTVLAEYELQDLAYELNFKAAQLAKQTAREYTTASKPRFVAGSMGPTTKLPSLGHISFRDLQAAYYEEVAGLIEGGADLLCIETCQDLLQTKAALAAARQYFAEKNTKVPVIASVTVEMTGTMLMGTEIAAALTALEPYDIIDIIGMNCATGPKEMEENIRYLCANSPKPVFCMPNAGIPENVGGQAHYKLTPEELEQWMEHFVTDLGVSLIGGCCGTKPEHIKRLADRFAGVAPKRREWDYTPSVSSIYASVPLRLDPAPLLVGERCNANGSKKFRELLLAEDYDAMVSMAKEQIREGAHVLDVCVAYVGRDEARDMREVMRRFNTQASIPLMIDSTEYPVIEEALQHCAGRAIVNSINLEDGEERLAHVLPLCKQYGAAVVALTIDEAGMAKTADKKFAIARRIRDLAVEKYGMREEDLIFDTLTFTLGSGEEEFRKSGIETIEAIRLIKQAFPKAHTILGVSNVSFGLNPHARHVLNSVFLHYAVAAGLDLAIVHASKIIPLYKVDERGRELCRELIFDERRWEAVA